MKFVKKIIVIVTLSLLFAVGAALLLQFSAEQLFSHLENVTYDWRYRLKYLGTEDSEFPDYGIHVVDIDERSMEKMGSYWGWDRGYQAKMVNSLSTRFPAAIAFDILFYDREDDIRYRRFAQILNESISGDTVLLKHSEALNDRLAAGVNYDKQFERAIANSGRVTLGIALEDESNYQNYTSQVAHRMDIAWHNSLNPASTLILPDSLAAQIIHTKSIIDGVYPENANAARQIGHVNIVDASSIIRTTPLLYRFRKWETSPIYLPMSIRIAATLFGTPNEEIVFVPERYIDIGKPFKIFKDADGRARFSYPDFTEAQFRIVMTDRDEITALGDGKKHNVSAYTAIFKDDSGRICLETRSERMPYNITTTLLRGDAKQYGMMGVDEEIDIGNGFIVRRDSELEWEIFSDDEQFWLNALDIKTLSSITPDDLVIEDGINRKLLTFDFWTKRENGVLVSSLPVLRSHTFNELLDSGPEALNNIPPNGRRDFGKSARIPLLRNNRHIVTYFGPKSKPFPYFSFYDIMENNIDFPMEGNVLIVGSTSPALFDIKSAPHEKLFPAVEIHATIMNSIFTDTYVRRLTETQDFLILVLIGFVAAIIAFLTKPFLGILLAGISLFAYSLGAFQVFNSSFIWIEMVRPMITIIIAFIAVMVYRYMTEEKNRKFLHSTFKQYLSPELIDMMYTQKQKPQLGGEEGTLSAFFTDIAGFSTFSEKLGSPTKLVELLNEYLTAMTDILLSHYGTLDKYVGDAIVAFFGAPVKMPDHAAKACRAALDMQKKLGELRTKWKNEGDKWPEIVHNMQMRIGINTGLVTTGNMGSAMRMNYTMMGDSVNLAARLESAAKYYGVRTIISEFTYDMIKDNFITRKLDMITVVGKTKPVTIYELWGVKDELTDESSAMFNLYNQGTDHYYAMNWDKALECFTEADTLELARKTSPDILTPSKRFADMCKKYMDNPPGEGWDGVNRLTAK